MSDQPIPDETRSEVVSIRFTPAEIDAIRVHLGDGRVSEGIRSAALAAAEAATPVPPWHRWHGETWTLLAQAARIIAIRGSNGSGIGIWKPSEARKLAAALLEAADVAEQRNPVDEAWDAEHSGAAS